MIVIKTDGSTLPRPSAVALGSFDGVHRGHAALLKTCVREAEARGLQSAVYTFLNHPGGRTGRPVKLLTTPSEKAACFEKLGIETVVFDRFTEAFSKLSPRQFVRDILKRRLRAAVCLCGFHYRFGAGGMGDVEMLRALCGAEGIEISVLDPVTDDGELISSSQIRTLCEAGEVARAALLLGRPYALLSRVVEGKKLGRELGFPTINQVFPPDAVIPKYGVYETRLQLDGAEYRGVTNVGCRPTVGGEGVNAETHILGFSGDLYGRMIRISFLRMLRPERNFGALAELQAQIARDRIAVETGGEDECL